MLDWLSQRLDVNELITRTVTFVPQLLAAIAVFLVFVLIYRVTQKPIRAILGRAGLHEKLVQLFVGSFYRWTVIILGVVMAVDQLGMDVAAALAGLGVAGIAIGFAAQDTLANVIAGFVIFMDKPFVVGDWITTEEEYGQVTNITMRTTRIRTPRNTYVVIPNKTIIDSVLENHSKHGELRIDAPVGIAYKEDIGDARRVLLQAVAAIEGIRKSPEPDVVVEELGGSSVNLRVRVWIDHADAQQATFFQVMEAAKLALDAAGIEIPFPHLQLFVDDVREPVWKGLERIKTRGA
jgi:small conductance mechanosensitive channel